LTAEPNSFKNLIDNAQKALSMLNFDLFVFKIAVDRPVPVPVEVRVVMRKKALFPVEEVVK